mgnify:CR=1 FL=1
MAKQKSSNGIDIELIYVKNGHQACYMHMMTMSNIKPKGNYVWTKKKWLTILCEPTPKCKARLPGGKRAGRGRIPPPLL